MAPAINRILKIWLRYRFIVFLTILIGSFVVGYRYLGPFLNSPEYEWIRALSIKFPLIGSLLNIEGMLVEILIATTVPLFTVWAFVLLYYSLNQNAPLDIELVAPYLSVFTSGTGAFVAALGGLVLGICSYGVAKAGINPPIIGIAILATALLSAGFYLKTAAKPGIKHRDWLHKHSMKFSFVFLALAFSAYIYGIVAEPIEVWNLVHEAYMFKNGS